MFGFISQKGPAPAFDGTVDMATNDLRGVLDWLAPTPAAPAQDRLKLSFSGKVLAGPKALNLSEFDIKIDNTKITGAAVVEPLERVSLGLNLDVDKINLDAYLPAPKNRRPQKRIYSKTTGDVTRPNTRRFKVASGTISVIILWHPGLLGELDINLKAKVGSLTVKGSRFLILRSILSLNGR